MRLLKVAAQHYGKLRVVAASAGGSRKGRPLCKHLLIFDFGSDVSSLASKALQQARAVAATSGGQEKVGRQVIGQANCNHSRILSFPSGEGAWILKRQSDGHLTWRAQHYGNLHANPASTGGQEKVGHSADT